jgi:uncharacterized protein involved in exopolysaccharide biosynthesis
MRSSAVLSSPVIADLRRQRTAAEAERAQLASRYGPRFPALVESGERISALDRQIREEQGRIIEGPAQKRAPPPRKRPACVTSSTA